MVTLAAGDFIVDDDGAGYAELGEDDHWRQGYDSEDAGHSGGEGDQQHGKKRKKGGAGCAAAAGGQEKGVVLRCSWHSCQIMQHHNAT
jgi:DNA polymerase alpha subunit A